jgi:hypothetical protein
MMQTAYGSDPTAINGSKFQTNAHWTYILLVMPFIGLWHEAVSIYKEVGSHQKILRNLAKVIPGKTFLNIVIRQSRGSR